MTFGPTLPSPEWNNNYTVLLQSDSLTSCWKLQERSGKAQVMSFIMDAMLHSKEYNRLKTVLSLGHVFGEGNPLADNLSRGDLQLFLRTCEILQVRPRKMEPPGHFKLILRQTCDFAATQPSRAP